MIRAYRQHVFAMTTAPEPDLRALLEKAHHDGILDDEEYAAKLAELDPALPQALVVRPRSAICEYTAHTAWVPLGNHATYEEGKAAIIKQGIYGKYKWAKKSGKPGDRRFLCSAHVECAHPLRLLQLKDGSYEVQANQAIEHSEEVQLKRRKNSVLTYEQEEKALDMMRDGTRISCEYRAYHMHIASISCISQIPYQTYHRYQNNIRSYHHMITTYHNLPSNPPYHTSTVCISNVSCMYHNCICRISGEMPSTVVDKLTDMEEEKVGVGNAKKRTRGGLEKVPTVRQVAQKTYKLKKDGRENSTAQGPRTLTIPYDTV